jgi:outer membrane protein assembly factor BamB
VVAGDVVLVGSCSGHFYGLDRETGAERWSYDTEPDGGPVQFHGDAAVAGDRVVTGSDRGDPACTYALALASGERLWKSCDVSIETDVLSVAGNAVGRTWNGDLVALDLESGELRWRRGPAEYRHRMRSDDSPVVMDGVVYFGGVDGQAYAVKGSSGEILWRRDTGARIVSVAADAEHVYVAAADRSLHRLARSDGRGAAPLKLAGKPRGRLTLAGGVLVLLLGEETLLAVDAEENEVLWSRESAAGWSSEQPLFWSGVIWVGDYHGSIHAFRLSDGEQLALLEVEGKVRGLGAAGGLLYVGTMEGMVYAVSRPGGLESASPRR